MLSFKGITAQETLEPFVNQTNVPPNVKIQKISRDNNSTKVTLFVWKTKSSRSQSWFSFSSNTFIIDENTGVKFQIKSLSNLQGQLQLNQRYFHKGGKMGKIGDKDTTKWVYILEFPPLPSEVQNINIREQGGFAWLGISINKRRKSLNKNNKINLKSENAIRDYFDKNGAKLIEGIWEYSSSDSSYRLAIIKEDYRFFATVIEQSGNFYPSDLKATFETAATDKIVTINWIMGDKKTNKRTVGTVTSNALIEFNLNEKVQLYRVYPKLGKKKRTKTGEWAGNGSGIIISKSGYIVTNHHVIEDAENIEVEFIIDGEVNKFNAEIVKVDKVNDLAIIKIFDINFDGLDDLLYNFKTRSSDVGTKIYAYGYPMALSLMGKEIKITDGIISSKSGFDGDIRTYQITAPIQGGNSGGPLFDKKGNFIGINSSGLRKDIADNVGYSIKSNYVMNLIDVLPKSIDLPSSSKIQSLPLTEQIKEISKYVVLVKVK